MIDDANGVNINSTRRSYHHGDLRAAVLEAALTRLDQGSLEGLSLREVARDVGVSATAIYRHFPDKDALLDALALEASERMGARQMAASAAAGGGFAGFNACGMAYVEFALAIPALFRLMISRTQLGDQGPDGAEASTAMRFLRQSIDAIAPPGSTARQRQALALHAWSLVHGLSVLMLDGQVPRDPALIQAVLGATGLWATEGPC